MSAVISWLDFTPWHFWAVALSATFLWLITVARERSPFWLWTIACFGLLLAWRWPYLIGPAILNPDEAHMIAGAITLRSFPVYWKYVDGTTHGPLVNLFLLFANWVGVPLNYGGARLVSGVLMIGGFLLSARGLRLIYPERAVRIGLAPAIFLWASIAFYDFAGYTSEQPVLFLLLASWCPLLSALLQKDISVFQRSWRLALGGLCLGAIPYAKLQGTPPGLALGLVAMAAVYLRFSSWRSRLMLNASLFTGAFLPSLMVGAYVLLLGLGHQFWTAYIQNNLLYAHAAPYSWREMIFDFWNMTHLAPGLQTILRMLSVFAVTIFVGQLWSSTREKIWPWVVRPPIAFWRRLFSNLYPPAPRTCLSSLTFIVMTAACLYATLAPRRPFGHYLQFLALPISLGGVMLSATFWSFLERRSEHARNLISVGLVLLLITPLILVRYRRTDPDMLGVWTQRRGEWRMPISQEIASIARPGDTLSVWGWMPYFYVETGLPQATREAHTSRQIDWSPMRDFYRARYLQDLERRPPRIFVDAVGGKNFGYGEDQPHWQESTHESFPALRDVIARDYILFRTAHGCRIYVRKQHS